MHRCRDGMSFLIAVTMALMTITWALPHSRDRRSGISDQRVAELETMMALARMRNKGRSGPVAYGLIDPSKIGKKKRSYDSYEIPIFPDSYLEELAEEFDKKLKEEEEPGWVHHEQRSKYRTNNDGHRTSIFQSDSELNL